jgi:hypothetical protein
MKRREVKREFVIIKLVKFDVHCEESGRVQKSILFTTHFDMFNVQNSIDMGIIVVYRNIADLCNHFQKVKKGR